MFWNGNLNSHWSVIKLLDVNTDSKHSLFQYICMCAYLFSSGELMGISELSGFNVQTFFIMFQSKKAIRSYPPPAYKGYLNSYKWGCNSI